MVIGVTILGFDERAVWRMTPRKLLALYEAYRELTGSKVGPKPTEEVTLDDILPEGV